MDLPAAFYVAACAAILMTGISKSGFGGGLGVMAVPIMSVFVAPQFAAAVMMPILLAMDILIVARFRKSWRIDVVRGLLPGALLGLILGALFFEYLNADLIRLIIGLLALAFVAQYLFGNREAGPPKSGKSILVGLSLLSGFASYVAHAGGPPVKGYLLSLRMPKSEFVATNTVYFFVLNSLKTVAYSSFGALQVQSLQVSLALAPVLFVGIWVGNWLHTRVDQRVFTAIVYGFLALTAARLLSTSIPALF